MVAVCNPDDIKAILRTKSTHYKKDEWTYDTFRCVIVPWFNFRWLPPSLRPHFVPQTHPGAGTGDDIGIQVAQASWHAEACLPL